MISCGRKRPGRVVPAKAGILGGGGPRRGPFSSFVVPPPSGMDYSCAGRNPGGGDLIPSFHQGTARTLADVVVNGTVTVSIE